MAWPAEERRHFIEQLNEVRSGLIVFYRYFLYALILLVTGFAVYLYQFSRDPNRAFLEFYFGIGYAVFVLFAVGQLFALRPRRSVSRLVTKNSQIDPAIGAGRFSLRPESPTADADSPGFPLRFGTKLTSVPKEDRPEDATLDKAYLSQGLDLETACRLLNTEYAQWSVPEQTVYRAYLKGFLDLRRMADPKAQPDSTFRTNIEHPAVESATRQESRATAQSSTRRLSFAQLAIS